MQIKGAGEDQITISNDNQTVFLEDALGNNIDYKLTKSSLLILPEMMKSNRQLKFIVESAEIVIEYRVNEKWHQLIF